MDNLPNGSSSSKIVFSTSPSELPILPQKPLFTSSTRPTSHHPLGVIEKETILKRQSLGSDLTVTQFEDFTCCFPNWSSPPSHLMAALSLDLTIVNPQFFLLPMIKRARMTFKEDVLLEDQRLFLFFIDLLSLLPLTKTFCWNVLDGVYLLDIKAVSLVN
jgi:hypothetical protein